MGDAILDAGNCSSVERSRALRDDDSGKEWKSKFNHTF